MKIGFFDSGIGGTTVLRETLSKICADYIYLGDIKNAPYGIKDVEEVKKYVFSSVDVLIKKGCKIIVVACNTATSVAIEELREKYNNVCIIGTEPAVKVAADSNNFSKALICSTSLTKKQEKLKNLIKNLNVVDRVDIVALDKLVTFAEGEKVEDKIIIDYLKESLRDYELEKYSHVVLGCTHFPLFIEYFKKVLPENISVIDGSIGITNNVKRHIKLINENLEFEYKNGKSSNVELIITKENKNFKNKFVKILGIKDCKEEIITNM